MKRQILISSLILLFAAVFATAGTIHVPGAYPYIDIQQAINIANSGDVIVIAPGTYIGTDYHIDKGITITGTDPNDPAIVAATVIDFDGQDVLPFDISGPRTVLSGITIANSHRGWVPVSDGVDDGDDGEANYDWYGYCGINIYDGNHIITNCIIRNCRAEGGPGGNGAEGGLGDYPDPCDPSVKPKSDGGDGGDGGSRYGVGIYIRKGNPQIRNTIFEDCVAIGGPGGYGGAGLDADVTDPNIISGNGGDGGNGGDAMGAGVYINRGSPIFDNCIIRNCEIRAGDAADGNDGGTGAIEEPNDNFHAGSGGHGGVPGLARGAGVYCAGGVNATFTNCQFIGNRAYGANGGDGGDAGEQHLAMTDVAGGIGGLCEESYSQPGTPQNGMPPSYFSAKGAGVYIENGSSATFTGCTSGYNASRGSVSGLGGWPTRGDRRHPRKNFPIPSYGAGVYCDKATTTFTDCKIQGNWTTQEPNQYPGDLYPYGSGEVNPDFQYADVEYIAYGGGMCLIGGILGSGNFGYVELNNCNINNNNAPVGGGVFASALTDFHVDECDFLGNWAYLGGGLFSIDNFGTISRSNFIDNNAEGLDVDIYGIGGGLFCFSSDVLISDCIISENTASGFGAGIYVAGEVAIPPLTAEPMLKNCLLSYNEAGLDGGGIYCDWYTEPNIINCTITGNEAIGVGGGLYCSYGSDVNIINSIFWDNAAQSTIGPELAVETWPFYPPTTLTVSNCDVEGGEEEVWVDYDSTLNWGAGNIDIYPLFVTGPLGNYYLSQIVAGQPVDSSCVDAGSNSAKNLGMDKYTTRTDEKPDRGTVDMGYHYPFTTEAEPCRFCELFRDGIINFKDFAVFALSWLSEDCYRANEWCQHADVTFDTYVNFEDVELFAECWLIEDTSPPLPNPSQWAAEPYPSWLPGHPNSISMAAQNAEDAWDFWVGHVQYYFECTTDGDASSGWQSSETYVAEGLSPETEYTFRVKVRDIAHNETGWSTEKSATVGLGSIPSDRVAGNMMLINDNAGWCWYQDEKIIYDPVDRSVITSTAACPIGFGGVGEDRDDDVDATIFNIATGKRTRVKACDRGGDDHNMGGLWIRPDGRYLHVYAEHYSPDLSYFRITTNPNDGTSWGSEQSYNWMTISGLPYDGGLTYTNLQYLSAEGTNGRLYNIVREFGRNPHISYSDDWGQTWNYAGRLSEPLGGATYSNYYHKFKSNGVDRIDFIASEQHPRNYNNSVYHGYIQGGNTYNSYGVEMDDSIFDQDAPTTEDFTPVFIAAEPQLPNTYHTAWTAELELDSQGYPVCLFQTRYGTDRWGDGSGQNTIGAADHRLFYGRFDGSSWTITKLCKMGTGLHTPEQDYLGIGCIHPNNANLIYVSTPFDPRDDTPLKHHEIFKGVTSDNGLSWDWTQITFDSTVDNIRPAIPSWDANNTAVFWSRGVYPGQENYDLVLVGMIDREIETPGLVSYIDADEFNTTESDDSPFTPTGPSGSAGAVDDQWHEYTGYGNGGSCYTAGDSGTENAPMLKTTISGLADGTYDVFAYFWCYPSKDWGIRGGFTSSDLLCFNKQSSQHAEASQFYGSVEVLDIGVVLYRVYIGRKEVSGGTEIDVYIDNYDSSFSGNVPTRTTYDGVGVARVTYSYIEDFIPPEPNPMAWATEPYATLPTSIAMVATTATDDTPPVEYYFECMNYGDASSGWQLSKTYVAEGLSPETEYTLRVKARDSATARNETGWSNPSSATTLPEGDYTPPAPVEWLIEPYETGGGMDAYANMTAVVATDPEGNGVQYYFQCVDVPGIFSGDCDDPIGFSSGWIDVPEWNDICIGRENQGLRFRFKVRDLSPNLNESAWSTTVHCFPLD